MNRIARTLLAAASVAALAAGCGVPGSSTPEEVGQAPGFGPPVGQRDVSLPDPAGASGPQELVERYLNAAAAGDWDPEVTGNQRIAKAVEHARRFLSDDLKAAWQPSADIQVVRVVFGVPSQNTVPVTMHVVGVLNENGALDQAQSQPPIVHAFTVDRTGESDRGGGEWRITGKVPPPSLFLSTAGLRDLFDVRPVYFWDGPGSSILVPDRRYLAKGVSRDKRIREVVDRLRAGPSDFLKQLTEIESLEDTFSGDNPVIDQSKIVVNLSVTMQPTQSSRLNRLASQLRWSLHPEKLPVELRIAGKAYPTPSGTEYLGDNPAQRTVRTSPDERLYGVLGGRVVATVPGSGTPPVLDAPDKCTVTSAALNGGRRIGAYVCGSGSTVELWLARWDRESTSVTRKIDLQPKPSTISRPSYLPDGPNRVLVAAGGLLYDVDEHGARPVELAPPGVTAVSVAPDGRRAALIAGDKLYVTTVEVGGAVRLGQHRLLDTPGLTQLTGVAWSYEHQLVVATAKALSEVAIDNGYTELINVERQLGERRITHVASMPVPWNAVEGGSPHGPLVIEASEQAYHVYPFGFEQPRLVEIAAPRPGASAAPSATPSQSAGAVQAQLKAPFFLDGE